MAIVGAKIRAMREKRGLTRTQLANLSGVNKRTIKQWEATALIYRCDLTRIMKIVVAMDCSLQDLVEDDQDLRIKNKNIREEKEETLETDS